jgi:hypothetical protein
VLKSPARNGWPSLKKSGVARVVKFRTHDFQLAMIFFGD